MNKPTFRVVEHTFPREIYVGPDGPSAEVLPKDILEAEFKVANQMILECDDDAEKRAEFITRRNAIAAELTLRKPPTVRSATDEG